jgi:hypothetical protein
MPYLSVPPICGVAQCCPLLRFIKDEPLTYNGFLTLVAGSGLCSMHGQKDFVSPMA